MIVTKVIELYETKGSRHSTMIVGVSNTAKTTTWKILQNTMTTMKSDGKPGFNAVHVYPINPKALSLGELYGEYNLSTGEWLDGVISSIMRKTCSGKALDWLQCNMCSVISVSRYIYGYMTLEMNIMNSVMFCDKIFQLHVIYILLITNII